jgi:UDPglucose 6-dehydrogenase
MNIYNRYLYNINSIDKRIGTSHMQVPGHDGKFGFGGPCLTKDCKALISYSKELNKPMTILKQVIETNNKIRTTYDTLSEREIEQNVNYNDEK